MKKVLIQNKAVENINGIKYNNRWWKIAGIVVGAAMGIAVAASTLTGCADGAATSPILPSSNSDIMVASDPNESETAPIVEDEVDLEAEWEGTKEEVKQQIIDWYSTNIASPETLRRLYYPEYAKEIGFYLSYCVLKENHLPNYGVYRSLIEIPEEINLFFEELDKVDASEISNQSDIQDMINKLLKQCGIYISEKQITFDGIPTIENETEESKNKIYAVTTGNFVYFVKNGSKFEDEKKYECYQISSGEVIIIKSIPDAQEQEFRAMNSEISYDIIFTTKQFDERFIKMTENGEEIEPIRIEVEDVLKRLAVIFGDNPEFQELCEEAGVKINTNG